MASKSATKSPASVEERASAAMLDLAAESGWAAVSLGGVARRANISLAQLRQHFDSRAELLTAWSRQVDARVLATAASSGAPRDRLFDLLMERFEHLNEHRAGALAVLRGLHRDPHGAATAVHALSHSVEWLLEAAAFAAGGVKAKLCRTATAVLYLHTLRTWMTDDSADLSATMAALDKNLGRAAAWGARFDFGVGEHTPEGDSAYV